MSSIQYNPPKTLKEFIKDHKQNDLFYDWIVGPIGSGKTTANFFKLIHLAKMQERSQDGLRHTRAVIVRNTLPQLKDTTITSWNYWFRDGQAGKWNATDKIFNLRVDDIDCAVMFRPLDTPEDAGRVLSLDINFAIVDEFVEIPRPIIDGLSGRLGRYRAPDWAKPSVWGMWGSSNPSTEDNWWYNYLHSGLPDNARYFVQPSGLSPDAENLENLPPRYYENAIKGKSQAWIKQYVEAEWGFSVAGQPVTPAFNADLHVAKKRLIFNPARTLVIGLDPGFAGSALIFGQQDHDGRLYVFDELVQQGYDTERLIRERLKPTLNERYPGALVMIAPDPASRNRAQTDSKTIAQVFERHFGRDNVRAESNNRFPLRLDAMDHFFTTLVPGAGPALQIDPVMCPILIRALKGGWRFEMDQKRETAKGANPEKNQYSHPGDAFGYLCRYFRKQTAAEERLAGHTFVPPRKFGSAYHYT